MRYYGSSGEIRRYEGIAIKEVESYINYETGIVDINASYIREIVILSMLKYKSRYIINLIDIDVEHLSFTMKEYPYSLEYYLTINPDLDNLSIKKIIYQIILGLKSLEDNNILHRDIKPGNILLDNNLNVKIIDFGLSCYNCSNMRDYDRTQTITHRSPEAIIYFYNRNSELYMINMDIWSLGIILRNLIYGDRYIYELISSCLYLEQISYYLYISSDIISENMLNMTMKTFNKYLKGRSKSHLYLSKITRNYDLNNEPLDEIIYNISRSSFSDYNSAINKERELCFRDILSKMIRFDPCNRYSATDLMKDSFFDDMRGLYTYNTYIKYIKYNDKPSSRLKDLYLMKTKRRSIIKIFIRYADMFDFDYIHLLNAIHILDVYSSMDKEYMISNKFTIIDDKILNMFIITCLIISSKLYRYIDEEKYEMVFNGRGEDAFFVEFGELKIFKDIKTFENISIIEINIVSAVYNKLYIPNSEITRAKNPKLRHNIIRYFEQINYIDIDYDDIVNHVSSTDYDRLDEKLVNICSNDLMI